MKVYIVHFVELGGCSVIKGQKHNGTIHEKKAKEEADTAEATRTTYVGMPGFIHNQMVQST